jgi:hypothetical protein
MTKTVDYDIVGSFNNQRLSEIDAERSINQFEYIDPLGKKKKTLVGTSGISNSGFEFTGATNGSRAQFVFNGEQFLVIGNNVYRISTSNVLALLGSITTSSGYVGVDANTFQVIFVDGQKGYIWDTSAETFLLITDTAFPLKPIDVCYLDGFFVVANGDTNNFQLSSFNQGMVWGAASNQVTTNIIPLPDQLIIGISNLTGGAANTFNFATGVPVTLSLGAGGSLVGTGLAVGVIYYSILVDATHIKLATTYDNAINNIAITITANVTPIINLISEGQLQLGSITTHPGTIVACRTLHRRLFLFSQFFTEVWENAGIGTSLPFRRNNSQLIELGTPAIGSISVGFDKMFFLSQDRDGLGSVMEVIGTQAIPISNKALDFQLSQYSEIQQISDCRSFLIKENGLIFYRMNFTLANHTYCYNVTLSNPTSETTKYWHEEEVLNGDRHPAQTHAYFNGKNYVGHFSKPILYIIDNSFYSNDGENIRRARISRAIVPEGYQRIRIDRLQIDLLQGTLSQEDDILEEINLLAENNFPLLTESEINLIIGSVNLNNPSQQWMYLSISKDGGQTYEYKVKESLGHVGQRTARTVWRKLGVIPRGQAFVTLTEYFEQTPYAILGASWAYEVLPE